MTVTASRIDDLIRFEVRFTNASGVTLSASNGATLTALVFEAPGTTATIPRVESAGILPVTTLADGETRNLSFEVATGIEAERTRWVVIADYLPIRSAPSTPCRLWPVRSSLFE